MKRMRRWVAALVVAVAAIAWLALRSDNLLVDWSVQTIAHYERKIGRVLRHQDIKAYWSFDGPRIVEWVQRGVHSSEGTRFVGGHFGRACRFLPDENGYVRTSVRLPRLGTNYTVCCRLRVGDVGRNQQVFQYLRVRDGRLFFLLPRQSDSIQYLLPRGGGYLHVAAVVDGGRGRAILYVDGVQVGACKADGGAHRDEPIVFGQRQWKAPPDFALDECSFWARPLNAVEVRAEFEANGPLLLRRAGGPVKRLRAMHSVQRWAVSAISFRRMSFVLAQAEDDRKAPIPEYRFLLSDKDSSVFDRYHEVRRENGWTAHGTSKKRKVGLVLQGREYPARMEVVGTRWDGVMPCRKSLSVEIAGSAGAGGSRRLLLFRPVETCPFLIELLLSDLAERADLSCVRTEICRVIINGRSEGIYTTCARAYSNAQFWLSAPDHRAELIERLPMGVDEALANFDVRAGQVLPLVAGDTRCPLGPRRLRREAAAQRRWLAEAWKQRGQNDESVARTSVSGVGVATNPILQFRMIPESRCQPILCIRTLGKVSAEERTPCVVRVLETDDSSSMWLPARIEYRGNTSLYKSEKKYYSIKMMAPHDLFGLGRSRYLLLTSFYRDATMMREKLAYDLFRGFGAGAEPRHAARFLHAELVLNGCYHGLYGVSDRIDGAMLGFDAYSPKAPRHAVLYKAVGNAAGFRRPARDAYIQKEPHWKYGEFWRPYDALISFLGQSPEPAFASNVEQVLDVDATIDFEILLNLTHNGEGRRYNLFLARGNRPDDRFFIVPWDYDMTFRGSGWLSNQLLKRLHRELPGYDARVQRRWRFLRKRQLSEGALTARIDGMAAVIASAAQRDRKRWPRNDCDSHAREVALLKDWTLARLTMMDAFIGGRAGGVARK